MPPTATRRPFRTCSPAGSVRDQTLFDVCMVLGLDFQRVKAACGERARDAPGAGVTEGRAAPVYMGAYTRAGVDQYIGSYLTLRPSFSNRRRASWPTARTSPGMKNGRACCFRNATGRTSISCTGGGSTFRPRPCTSTSSL